MDWKQHEMKMILQVVARGGWRNGSMRDLARRYLKHGTISWNLVDESNWPRYITGAGDVRHYYTSVEPGNYIHWWGDLRNE